MIQTSWVGTTRGFGFINLLNKTYYPFASDTLGNVGLVLNIIKDHQGNLWFSTLGGLICYDRQHQTTRWYLRQNHWDRGNSLQVVCLYEDQGQNLWVGTGVRGLYSWTRTPNKRDTIWEHQNKFSHGRF